MLVKLTDDIFVDPCEVAVLEFQFVDRRPATEKAKSLIVQIAADWKDPRAVISLRSGHTINFKLSDTVTEEFVRSQLDVKRVP